MLRHPQRSLRRRRERYGSQIGDRAAGASLKARTQPSACTRYASPAWRMNTKPADGNPGDSWQVWCCTCQVLVIEGRGVPPDLRGEWTDISQPEIDQHLRKRGVHQLQLTMPEVRTIKQARITED